MGLTRPRPHQINRKEANRRIVIKTVTGRSISAIITFFISWAVTKDIDSAILIVAIYSVLNTMIHIAHEQVWNKIKWGK